MSRHQEILDLLRSNNPAPPPRETGPDRHLADLSVMEGDRDIAATHRRGLLVAFVAFLLVATAGSVFLIARQPSITASQLVGTYRGSLLREGGPGNQDVRQFVELKLAETEEGLTGTLIHSPADALSLDSAGNARMPLEVELVGSSLGLRWDPSVSTYQDSSINKCQWESWELDLRVGSHLDTLSLIQGSVDGLPPEGPQIEEFFSGCPTGERAITRLVLLRQ